MIMKQKIVELSVIMAKHLFSNLKVFTSNINCNFHDYQYFTQKFQPLKGISFVRTGIYSQLEKCPHKIWRSSVQY